MTLGDKFEIPSGVVAKQLSGETVILDLEKGIYFGLNAVGSRIWQMLDEDKTLGEICDRLFEEYEVSRSDLEMDTLALVAELKSRGLIELA